jgi:hypothetical protein
MNASDPWVSYAPSYRSREIDLLARWAAAGISGSVVGLVGSGRSNLLRYVCEHPTAFARHLPPDGPSVTLVAVDLHDLPSDNLYDLHRILLHAFYWVRTRLPAPLAEAAAALYLEHRTSTDAFLTQTALYELLLAFQREQQRVVLVLNRFDRFCQLGTLSMVNSLRSLRDRFRETLSYLVGMRQAVTYLPNPAQLGDMYELFDSHVCYVGALTSDDSRHLLGSLPGMRARMLHEADIDAFLRLSGGFPVLLKAVGLWWLAAGHAAPREHWCALLLQDPAIQYRLERLWGGLTQEEQLALGQLARVQHHPVERMHHSRQRSDLLMERLAAKGCCAPSEGGWYIQSELLAAHVLRAGNEARGRIWWDESSAIIYQNQQPLDGLTPMEYAILRFLLAHPRTRHTSETIIERVWPATDIKEAISANNLQVHVSGIRKKIEPNPTDPAYLITWHGRPGGYLFFPEGKPK